MCGAPTRTDASNCEHCGARLATVACPACFGMIFEGSKFCPLCGVRADRKIGAASGLNCPHCATELTVVAVGKSILSECGKCEGLWLDKLSFDLICASREEQAAALGQMHPHAPAPLPTKVRYIKCPECHEMMNRVNFAQSSGVVLDVCRTHGVWLDADELQRICLFISEGGLDRARQKEIANLREERKRLEQVRREAGDIVNAPTHHHHAWDLGDVVLAVGTAFYNVLGSGDPD